MNKVKQLIGYNISRVIPELEPPSEQQLITGLDFYSILFLFFQRIGKGNARNL